jgi:N-acetylglucosamine-6-phosphate deacetylase
MNPTARGGSPGGPVADGVGAAGSPDRPELDADGLIVAPGLIDLQVNGAHGVDITAEPHRLWEVAAALPAYGVTAFLPTVITSSPEARAAALETLAAGRPAGVPAGAVPLGLHFEGPMIAASHKGAHPLHWLAPASLNLVSGWSREAGVAMVTLAPELPGAVAVISERAARGIVVSVGHTAATSIEVAVAAEAGATAATHLFNAMPPLLSRAPGPVGAVFDGSLVAGVLVDGHHLAPSVVRLAWRVLGPERFLSVSDTTAALGLADGRQRLGDQEVVIADGAVRLADGTLAGTAASLVECLRELVRVTGCSTEDAIATPTSTPAALMRDASRGRLEPGCRGDLVLLSEDLEVVATVVAGEVVHDARRG